MDNFKKAGSCTIYFLFPSAQLKKFLLSGKFV